jgi:hypothetical protein
MTGELEAQVHADVKATNDAFADAHEHANFFGHLPTCAIAARRRMRAAARAGLAVAAATLLAAGFVVAWSLRRLASGTTATCSETCAPAATAPPRDRGGRVAQSRHAGPTTARSSDRIGLKNNPLNTATQHIAGTRRVPRQSSRHRA